MDELKNVAISIDVLKLKFDDAVKAALREREGISRKEASDDKETTLIQFCRDVDAMMFAGLVKKNMFGEVE